MTIKDVELAGLSDLDEIRQSLTRFSATIVAIGSGPTGEVPVWAASGTFIRVGGRPCILTAHHVYTELKNYRDFALAVRRDKHRYPIPMAEVEPVEIAAPSKGKYGPDGPDLAALLLSNERGVDIEAKQPIFYDLDKHLADLNLEPFRHEGTAVIQPTTRETPLLLWGLSGSPAEGNVMGNPLSRVGGIVGITGHVRSTKAGAYHFLDVSVVYEEGTSPPENFEGMSGSGLWLLPYIRRADQVLRWSGKAILAGVAFWQSDRVGADRFVRCHGPLDLNGVVREQILKAVRART